MRYYVVADTHGFYTQTVTALKEAGYFEYAGEHKLVMCGDIFDRGKEAAELQNFITDLMAEDGVILIRGNHEDLFLDLIDNDGGFLLRHHVVNGTYGTALQLTGFGADEAYSDINGFVEKARSTSFYKSIIPAMRNYFETDNYIFVHGWIPVIEDSWYGQKRVRYNPDWRNATDKEWENSRWSNGMDLYKKTRELDKTIVCGHWHCSYGPGLYEQRGSESGADADYTPYYDEGIIAIDACTARSGRVNCIVIDD